jgi:hypothetical protein
VRSPPVAAWRERLRWGQRRPREGPSAQLASDGIHLILSLSLAARQCAAMLRHGFIISCTLDRPLAEQNTDVIESLKIKCRLPWFRNVRQRCLTVHDTERHSKTGIDSGRPQGRESTSLNGTLNSFSNSTASCVISTFSVFLRGGAESSTQAVLSPWHEEIGNSPTPSGASSAHTPRKEENSGSCFQRHLSLNRPTLAMRSGEAPADTTP